jgi:hypothetical protein
MLTERKAASIGELLEAITDVRKDWGTNKAPAEEIWFRGNGFRSYNLLPGLYRDCNAKYAYDESTLFETFKALATPLVTKSPSSEWEWYFLAQHYGLPTRLLDWTENLFAALYFAVAPHAGAWDRPTFDSKLRSVPSVPSVFPESPTVWVLETGTLNQHSVLEDCVVVPGGPQLDKYLPGNVTTRTAQNKLPVGIFPARGSSRIVAQQGMFTIHGHKRVALEELAGSSPEIRLAAVVLDQASVPRLWEELRLAGINRLSLFPDLSSVAPHVCWLYQSSVDVRRGKKFRKVRVPRKRRVAKRKR